MEKKFLGREKKKKSQVLAGIVKRRNSDKWLLASRKILSAEELNKIAPAGTDSRASHLQPRKERRPGQLQRLTMSLERASQDHC